jgi:hypothetical protein
MTDDKANHIEAGPEFLKRYYHVDRSQIGYLRFLIESYDGLMFLRTLDKRKAIIEIAYAPSRRRDAEGLLASLADEAGMHPVDPPDRVPPL